MEIATFPRPATSVPCPACESLDRLTTPEVVDATHAVAAEIARGGDLGGILELAHALVTARVEAGIAGDTPTTAALQAAATVIIKVGRVFAEFRKLGVPVSSASRCPACEIHHQLDPLVGVAATAAARRELTIAEGVNVPEADDLVEAVRNLAGYAGDAHPDAGATRNVLSLAIKVFAHAAARR